MLGYFYLLEYLLMIVPGLNALYPFLPGGATAALTDFTFLADTLGEETSLGTPVLLSPPLLGALVLAVYALGAAAIAMAAPLRRDLA